MKVKCCKCKKTIDGKAHHAKIDVPNSCVVIHLFCAACYLVFEKWLHPEHVDVD